MERQSGLGRSLGDVLDALTPVDPDPAAAGRVLFEPEDLEQQLDSLMGDIRDLRERVQHLVALVPDAEKRAKTKKKSKKAKNKKKHHKKAKKAKKHKPAHREAA
jgi:hypothetical protein